jgi:hypothetical protein
MLTKRKSPGKEVGAEVGGPSLGPPKMISDSKFHRPLKQEGAPTEADAIPRHRQSETCVYRELHPH